MIAPSHLNAPPLVKKPPLHAVLLSLVIEHWPVELLVSNARALVLLALLSYSLTSLVLVC